MNVLYRERTILILLALAALFPFLDSIAPSLQLTISFQSVFIFALLGLGLNVVSGLAGMLNLGVAAFMAVGAYTYAILTCNIYPFQLGFWGAVLISSFSGALAGLVLGAPTVRLKGDYVAIVTLGFGEIVQDALRNLDSITKGTQGINPLPGPSLPWVPSGPMTSYYVILGLLALALALNINIERSKIGRALISLREDELAARCMGVDADKMKLLAFAFGAAFCALAGALYASLLGTSGEPRTYDFQISVIALCIVIVGGLGSIRGVLLGAAVMVGFNTLVISKLSDYLGAHGIGGQSVFASPNNWKSLIFGLALVIMMRLKPEGLWPSRRVKAELHTS